MLFTILIVKLYYSKQTRTFSCTERGRVLSHYNWWVVTDKHNYSTAYLNLSLLSCLCEWVPSTKIKHNKSWQHSAVGVTWWLQHNQIFPYFVPGMGLIHYGKKMASLKIRKCPWLQCLHKIRSAVDSQFSLFSVTCVHIFNIKQWLWEQGTMFLSIYCSCVSPRVQ